MVIPSGRQGPGYALIPSKLRDKQIEPGHGANQNITAGAGPKVETRKSVGEAAGMSERQVKTAVRVASVPTEDFEKQVESATPPTVTALAQQGTKPAARPVVDLKGRDPAEFNRSLHFVAEFEAYQRSLEILKPGIFRFGL